MDLADFLAAKLAQSTYRDLEAQTGVSRGSLEAIIKRQNVGIPSVDTMRRIGKAYGMPLWQVVQLAGVDLDLPQTQTEVEQRLDVIAQQVPGLNGVVQRLNDEYVRRPDFVKGIVIFLEASLTHPDTVE